MKWDRKYFNIKMRNTPQWHSPTTSHIHRTWIFSFHPLWNHVKEEEEEEESCLTFRPAWGNRITTATGPEICSRWNWKLELDMILGPMHDSSRDWDDLILEIWGAHNQWGSHGPSQSRKIWTNCPTVTGLGNRWLWPQCQISKNKIHACKVTEMFLFFDIPVYESQRKRPFQLPCSDSELAFICWSTSSASEELIAVMRFSAACQTDESDYQICSRCHRTSWLASSVKKGFIENLRSWDLGAQV